MEKKLNELIENYRKGDKNQFLLIMGRFDPMIYHYTKLLFKDDTEDTISELHLTLLETVQKMHYYNDERQCGRFLSNAIKIRFMELYRNSRKRFDHEVLTAQDYEICTTDSEYALAELVQDFKQYISDYNDIQKKILISIFIEGKNNSEAASIHNVSRQYANQLKNKLCRKMRIAYAV